jgi:hypothetical protein
MKDVIRRKKRAWVLEEECEVKARTNSPHWREIGD